MDGWKKYFYFIRSWSMCYIIVMLFIIIRKTGVFAQFQVFAITSITNSHFKIAPSSNDSDSVFLPL